MSDLYLRDEFCCTLRSYLCAGGPFLRGRRSSGQLPRFVLNTVNSRMATRKLSLAATWLNSWLFVEVAAVSRNECDAEKRLAHLKKSENDLGNSWETTAPENRRLRPKAGLLPTVSYLFQTTGPGTFHLAKPLSRAFLASGCAGAVSGKRPGSTKSKRTWYIALNAAPWENRLSWHSIVGHSWGTIRGDSSVANRRQNKGL